MNRTYAAVAFAAGFFLLSAASADPKPSPILVCEMSCRVVRYTPFFHPQLHPISRYPSDLHDAGVEGMVKLAYDVQPGGHASNIVVLTRLGPPALADISIATLQAETFGPGTEDGVPAVSRGLVHVETFSLRDPAAHADFTAAYALAQKLIAQDKAAEAVTTMKAALNLPVLSLFEYAGAEDLLAVAYLQLRDGAQALRAVDDAEALALNTNISASLKRAIHRAHVAAAEMTHRYREALGQRDTLKALGELSPGDDETFARLQAIVDGGTPITVHGVVPIEGTASWTYDLAHAAFAIANVKGAVTRYGVSCTNTSPESPTGGPLQAKLPPGWSSCWLVVYGTPGTTFDVIDG